MHEVDTSEERRGEMRLRCCAATAALLAAAVGGVGGVALRPRSWAPSRTATGGGQSDAWRVAAPQIVVPLRVASEGRAAAREALPAVPTTPRPAPLRDTSSLSHTLLELEREARLAGQYLVRSPAALRGFCGGSGQQTEVLPVLSNAETLGLIQRSWFFITASEARRELQAEASGPEALYAPPVSHSDVLQRMRDSSADEREQPRRKGGEDEPAAAGGAPCSPDAEVAPQRGSGCAVAATGMGAADDAGETSLQLAATPADAGGDVPAAVWAVPRAGASSPYWPSRDVAEMRELLPPTMCDVEFRLRETIGRAAHSQLFAHNQVRGGPAQAMGQELGARMPFAHNPVRGCQLTPAASQCPSPPASCTHLFVHMPFCSPLLPQHSPPPAP
jgi:hypothetical protein